MRVDSRPFLIFAFAVSLAAIRPTKACLVEPEFPAPTIAFVPANIVVPAPTPALRMRPLYSPVRSICCHALLLPPPPAVDGLVDLFGSLANLRTAVATQEVSFALDGFAVLLPCSLGVVGEPQMSDATLLRDLLLNDAAYDWSSDGWCKDDSDFTARLTFASSGRSIVAEIAPQCGVVRVLVNAREVGRAKLRLDDDALELLLIRTRHTVF